MPVASFLLVLGVLWLPGAALRRRYALAPGSWGTGTLAVTATLSLAAWSVCLLPAYVAGAPLPIAAGLAAVVLVAAVAALLGPAHPQASPLGASRGELVAFAAAVATLLPVAAAHSGANVDDWWDLSFAEAWLGAGHFTLGQPMLSPLPGEAPAAHPRFLWSVWLTLQTLVSFVTGEETWRLQAGPWTAAVVLLVVSAQAALVRALAPSSTLAVALAPVAAAAWLWGSEALPFFHRAYQDKHVAAWAVAPVLIALWLELLAGGAAPPLDQTRRRRRAAIAAASVAAVSVHSLVLTMAACCCVAAALAASGGGVAGRIAWVRGRAGDLVALLLPALYPFGQALALAGVFREQGISLAHADNPVVRAHLGLDRLVLISDSWWVVHPAAVFGPIAVVALLWWPWLRRRVAREIRRAVDALVLVPFACLFVPGLSAIAGALWVPWMLYRLGWMVPVAALLATGLAWLWESRRSRVAGTALALATALAAATLAGGAAADRLRRDMADHPDPPPALPFGDAMTVYRYLAAEPERGAVLAMPSFAELVPTLSRKPVVAFSERGTLVFAMDEAGAYRRLRDRAEFFFRRTPLRRRNEIAERYGVRWAVFARRHADPANAGAWLSRFGPEAFLAAEMADAGRGAEPPWTRAPARVAAALGPAWRVALVTPGYLVMARDGGRGGGSASDGDEPESDAALAWLRPFPGVATAPGERDAGVRGAIARVAATPGAAIAYRPPPRFATPSLLPIWVDGPSPWEDAPAEVEIEVDMGAACPVSTLRVVAHLPRERREVLEVRARPRGGAFTAAARAVAYDGRPIDLDLGGHPTTDAWVVEVRSLLGNPVSLADVRLIGDAALCQGEWPRWREPRSAAFEPAPGEFVDLVERVPTSARALVALARRAAREGRSEAARELLVAATQRDPGLVEAWVELGFALDDEGRTERAIDAFEAAVRADSRSAWARGCLAWADWRRGRPLRAALGALAAADEDASYGDAWTILAYALADLGVGSLAERALARAETVDPDRNWPAMARADLALARRDAAAAERALIDFLERDPFDLEVTRKLAAVRAANAVPAAAATSLRER